MLCGAASCGAVTGSLREVDQKHFQNFEMFFYDFMKYSRQINQLLRNKNY